MMFYRYLRFTIYVNLFVENFLQKTILHCNIKLIIHNFLSSAFNGEENNFIFKAMKKLKSYYRHITLIIKMIIDSFARSNDKLKTPSILFISHDASRTGAPFFLLDLIKLVMLKLNMRCIVLLAKDGELISEFKKITETYLFPKDNFSQKQMIKKLKNENIKLVYSNTITNGSIHHQLRELNCMICCHVHELSHSIKMHYDLWNLNGTLETTKKYLAGSKKVFECLEHTLKIPKKNIALAYPFINIEKISNKNSKEVEFTVPRGTVVVGACATLTWRKGPDLFLQIARMVIKKTNKPVFFVWIGGPCSSDNFKNLQDDIKKSGLDKQIMYLDNVKNHLSYFSKFDIFLLPSREDPFPLVVLDAAAMSIPILCFDQAGGAPEFVENDAGIVIPYLDLEDMAYYVLELINDNLRRKELGKMARKKLLDRHQASVGGDYIVNLINEMLSEKLYEISS